MARNTSHIQSTNSDHKFALAPQANIARSKFDLSRNIKTTFNAGILYPIYFDEILPGDTFNLSTTAICRLATPLFPIMDNIYLDFHFYFVPNRIVWDNWEEFCGYQANPTDTTDYLVPTVTSPTGGFAQLSLYDYFGLPTALPAGTAGGTITVDALIFRAYNLIWNDWYRDENIQDSVTVSLGDGPDANTLYTLLPRGKRKDYFTSCLPFPQKGPDVLLPLGSSAPIYANGLATTVPQQALTVQDLTGGVYNMYCFNGNALNNIVMQNAQGNGYELFANLTQATSATINEIRQAFQVQKLYERDARGGTRYVEILHSHFGVISPDFRLQRPEYLGGGTMPMFVTPVPQTVPAGAIFTSPQGNLAGFGVAHAAQIGFTKSFTEHGYVIGLVSARADLNYQSGIHRMHSRQTRLDFYWPVFATLGEQAVLNQEIFAQGSLVIDSATAETFDSGVFGYQECWAEYRYGVNLITGLFRSNATNSLDAWHLAQDFTALPTLSPSFIEEDPPMDRIEAQPSQPSFIMDAHFTIHAARPMPLYSVPGLVDHH